KPRSSGKTRSPNFTQTAWRAYSATKPSWTSCWPWSTRSRPPDRQEGMTNDQQHRYYWGAPRGDRPALARLLGRGHNQPADCHRTDLLSDVLPPPRPGGEHEGAPRHPAPQATPEHLPAREAAGPLVGVQQDRVR